MTPEVDTLIAMLVPLLSLPVIAQAELPADTIYVAPDGSDDGSGAIDAPLATLAAARDRARLLRRPDRQEPLAIALRGGTYFLREPLVLTPEDSGTAEAPLLICSFPGERAVISGGIPLSGFEETPDGWWRAPYPDNLPDAISLYVNGVRRGRPRLPRDGYYHIRGEVEPSAAAEGRGYDRFLYRGSDLDPAWEQLSRVEVLAFHQWSMSRLPVRSIDAEARMATVAPTGNRSYWHGLLGDQRYIVENVREALGEPGQYYIDREADEILYVPAGGEALAEAEVIVPALVTLIEVAGDANLGLLVRNVRIEGLTLAHTGWQTPADGYSFPQAEAEMPAAIHATGANALTIDRCEIAHTAGYAIHLGAGSRECVVENGALWDLGAGGVKIGETYSDETREDVNAGQNTVRHCAIMHGGRTHPAGIGVWIGRSSGNLVEHCTIADLYYTSISVGWSWGYANSTANNNEIAYNHMYTIGQGVLSDMGGIYTLGVSPGSRLHHNHMHDIEAYSYGGWGIYFDEGTTYMTADHNLVHHTKTGTFHQHYGRENLVTNNILALSRTEGQIIRTRAEEHLSFTFEHNIVYWTEGPLLGSNWEGNNYSLNHNLYWNPNIDAPTFAGMSFDEWRAKGQDTESVFADPRFADPDHGDFTLPADSPAFDIGFQAFSVADAGASLPPGVPVPPAEMPRAFPPPPPPRPIAEDFEDHPVGSLPVRAGVYDGSETAVVRVSDEEAASGTRSLKFVDEPGLDAPWNPHIFYQPGFSRGRLRGHFDVRISPGVVFYHEWRTAGQPYRSGPSLIVDNQGTLRARDRELGTLPLDTWVSVDIDCSLEPAERGRWSLTVTTPSDRWTVEDLPCDPEFDSVQWFGFCAKEQSSGVFYLDNIRLEPTVQP